MAMRSLALLTLSFTLALSAPLVKRDGFSNIIASLTPKSGSTPVAVPQADIDALGLKNAAALASASYCPTVAAGKWNCPTCATVPDLQLLYTGGDGNSVPKMFVGFSKGMNAIVVSHEGTQQNLDAWINNLDAFHDDLDPSIAKGASLAVQVHEGFQDAWLATSTAVLQHVQSALAGVAKGASYVLLTGHSKGAAGAVYDAIHLRQQLPNIPVHIVGFGQPRIGNSAWSDFAASVLGDSFVHVTNDNDVVPRLPGTFLGYEQTITELWINDSGNLVLCPGVENKACSAGVSDFDLSSSVHDGPYFGIMMNDC